jgi:AmmeMemoRadiSam system protein B/AmmeMemoRadiSam system protein A
MSMRQSHWIKAAAIVGCCVVAAMPSIQAMEPRQARAAGNFYPEEPEILRQMVTDLLAAQTPAPGRAKPRLLIVPHAGYAYSGAIAAAGYRQVQGQSYDGVVVVGFTHRGQFPGFSVDLKEAYHTPLGDLAIDQTGADVLAGQPGFNYIEEAHEGGEHSMEVQLPFIQVVLPQAKVVPVLLGNVSLEDARQLADALAMLAQQGDYLFVFSTDLSHYHAYPQARRIDQRTVEALLQETPQAVNRLFEEGVLEACGRGPIVTALLLGAKLGYPARELLAAANSGDTTGQPDRVVGYAAIGFFDAPPGAAAGLSDEAGTALVKAARATLQAALDKGEGTLDLGSMPALQQSAGLFVTLRKGSELRGCIGHIEADEPLARLLPKVALDAALRDPRFSPVTAAELPELAIEVSVLTLPRAIASAAEIVPGRDGVILEHEGHRGVFLPVVWEETTWTREAFLRGLASEKAGLAPEAWQHATLSIFQAQVFQEPAS